MYNKSKNRLDQETVHEIFKDAVAIEKEFITESIPCALLGMNSTLMNQYIEYISDRLLVQLGYETVYDSTNPFEFMEEKYLN